MALLALVPSIDADALAAGFALIVTVTFIAWWALLGLNLARRLLSEAAE